MEVIVPDEFLSIAIGKKGQNVRLASKLTKWHLDVTSETRYSGAMQDGYDSLVSLPDLGISLADALYEKGFFSAYELSKASVEDLIQIRDVDEEKAIQLIEAAKEYLLSKDQADETSEEAILEEEEHSETSDVSVSPKTSENQTGSDEDDEIPDVSVSPKASEDQTGSDENDEISDVSVSPKTSENQTGSDEDVSKETILSDDKEVDSAEEQNNHPDK